MKGEIDWDCADFDNFGDPWADFMKIGDNVGVSPHFATGQIHGYFGGEPPEEFWQVLALYLSASAITAIAWSLQFGQKMTDEILTPNNNVLKWFDICETPFRLGILVIFAFNLVRQFIPHL